LPKVNPVIPDPKTGRGATAGDSVGAGGGSAVVPFVEGEMEGAPNNGFGLSESDFLNALPNPPNPTEVPNVGAVVSLFGDACALNTGIVGTSVFN